MSQAAIAAGARIGLRGEQGLDASRLGMLIFIGAETMLFAGFVAAFLVFRLEAPVWPPPSQPRLPIEVTGLNTLVLLLSGWTMTGAARAAREGNRRSMARSLGLTAALALAFLGVQGFEWVRLIGFGLTASSGIYGGLFYAVVGAHAIHLAAALAWLLAIACRAGRGASVHPGARLPALAIYWYFVVALWPVLYAIVYLA